MTAQNTFRTLFGLTAALLFSTSVVRAQGGGIRDNAAFFSETAKAEASRNIGEIGRRFKKDVVIETFKTVPDDIKQGVNLQDRVAVNRMFEQWTRKQAQQQRVNGLYILLSKEPAHLQVVVGNETQNAAFTLRDRDTLVSAMLAKLRNKQNDDALLEGVNFVASTMKSHAVAGNRGAAPVKREAPAEESSPWGWVIAAVLGFGAAWLVVRIIRSMFSSGVNAGGAGATGGGGGFMSSLLGGMFGAAAGMWLYNQFSSHHGSDMGGSGSGDADLTRKDSDYSSSGGDFSDDSGGGGGDIGGGDSGGGDF